MDTDQIVRGGGPEKTIYDKARHERMRLRNIYGGERFFLDKSKMTCCEACVFGSGAHSEFCIVSKTAQ